MSCFSEKEILRHLSGRSGAEVALEMERHLGDCAICSGRKRVILEQLQRLSPDDGEFEEPALADNVMTLIRLGQTGPELQPLPRFRGVSRWLIPALSASIALIAVVLWVLARPGDERDLGFQARGAGEPSDAWVRIAVYQTTPGGTRPVRDNVLPGDYLAFSYDNPQGTFRYLMILAVQATGEIFWFYPAYTQEGSDPQSIPIEITQHPRTLPDEIQHPLKPGPLAVLALFSERPLQVSAVEEEVRKELPRLDSLDGLRLHGFEETGQQMILLRVLPSRDQVPRP